jgi:hypothetical protein
MEPDFDSALETDPTDTLADLRQSAHERTLGAKCCQHNSGRYYTIRPGDTCADITTKGGISLPNLDSLNSDIKTDCANLVVGERYCVLPVVDFKE